MINMCLLQILSRNSIYFYSVACVHAWGACLCVHHIPAVTLGLEEGDEFCVVPVTGSWKQLCMGTHN